MCKEELLFCRISTLNVENSTVLSRFSTFSTNAMLKTWKNTNCNTQKKRALCAIPFLWEPKRKKGKLRISRGYPQSFFVCRMYPCICCLYPFGAHDTPSGHAIPLLDASSPEIVCSKKEMPSLRCAPISYCKRFFLAKANQRNLCDPPRFFKAEPLLSSFFNPIGNNITVFRRDARKDRKPASAGLILYERIKRREHTERHPIRKTELRRPCF